MGYYKPFPPRIQRGQRFGDNPGWGPNPPGGHNGDDYLSQVGEPVYAAGDGVVVFAGRFDSTYADNWGWNLNYGGQMVVLNLDGADGPYVEYGHNSELRVNTGDRVTAGQVIALSGEDDGGTHVITGPHLHVGCLPPNFDLGTNTYGRVNPDIYLTDYPDETGIISVQSATITQEDDLTPEESAQLAYIASPLFKQHMYQAVWFGHDGGDLIQNRRTGRGEWPETFLGSIEARVRDEILPPALANVPPNVLNQTIGDGTKTNVAGALSAILNKPAAVTNVTSTAPAVDVDALVARLKTELPPAVLSQLTAKLSQ